VHRSLSLALLSLVLMPLEGLSSPQQPLPPPLARPGEQREEPPIPPPIQREMEKRANKQRQEDLKRDAEKLLKLSTELKDYVDKSNENVLSLDVVKKAEEIEKLAHSVKTKMRGY